MEASLKLSLINHFEKCGIGEEFADLTSFAKSQYRSAHAYQRAEKLADNQKFLSENWHKLKGFIANGHEVNPEKIQVKLELIESKTLSADIFRLISLNWSIPVSEGYGRRMRFLVWDKSNDKVIGIFALGDAVFNIKVRDSYIGWTSEERKTKLVNVMDAYILGAAPPYNELLCGKLIASLIKSSDVANAFRHKYKDSVGLISGNKKNPYLTVVTLTSALGRSSVYNRLNLDGESIFKKIGMTEGWGHFHVSNEIFIKIVKYLREIGDSVVESYSFGGGPNWKIRIIKRALKKLGMHEMLMRHGFLREVYICEMANNSLSVLLEEEIIPDYTHLKTVEHMSTLAINRWVIPRSKRNDSFKNYNRDLFLENLKN